MSLKDEQCNKVCRILDDVLANRPTERDALIVAVKTAFNRLEYKTGHWLLFGDCYMEFCKCSNCGHAEDTKKNFCSECGADMRGGQDEWVLRG